MNSPQIAPAIPSARLPPKNMANAPAAIMNKVAENPKDEANLAACKAEAQALIAKFPLYPAGSFEE